MISCDIRLHTVFPLKGALGAYLTLKLQGATLIVRRRLKTRGPYFKER